MRPNSASRLLCALLFANLVAEPFAGAQQNNGSTNNTPSPSPAAEQPAPSNLSGSLGSLLNSTSDLGDYVPCEFTIAQLRDYRPEPVADYLTSNDAEAVKKSVITAALDPTNRGSFANGDGNDFAQKIGAVTFNLDGRTRSEALSLIIATLQPYQAAAVKAKAIATVQQAQVTAANVSATQGVQGGGSPTEPGKPPQAATGGQSVPTAPSTTSNFLSQLKNNLNEVNVSNLSSTDAANKLSDASRSFVLNITLQPDTSNDLVTPSQTEPNNRTKHDSPAPNSGTEHQADQSSATQPADQATLNTVKNANEAVQSTLQKAPQDLTKSGQAIVDSARTAVASAGRPLDVGCAMAILSWHEVQVAFGRSVANEYIGVQVVVRNLNADKQFLIHDSELAVDADLNGRLGRFYSGRDQKIVRAISISQQAASVRNLVVNIAGAIGTIASAAQPFAPGAFKDATGVYNSGFLSALTKTWPDHSIDQLNLLNDVGFSASTDSKEILVPKSGAAMFVMFVPAKQFEEGWWTQDCAHQLAWARPTSNSQVPQPSQTISNSQAASGAQTASGSQTTVSNQTTTSTTSTSTAQTVPIPQPALPPQSGSSAQPAAASQPVSTPPPVSSSQPASTPQAMAGQPAASATPQLPPQFLGPLQTTTSTQTTSTSDATTSTRTTPIVQKDLGSQPSSYPQNGQSYQPSPSPAPKPTSPPVPLPAVSPSSQVGVNLQMAQTACGQTVTAYNPNAVYDPNTAPVSPARKKYKDWSPTADSLFRELAFAVVAGTHITEENSTKPTVATLDCPKDQLGNVDFTQQVKGSVTCSLTGTNLDQVNKLKLRDAADATDNTTADGSVTISGDKTKGNVDFPLAQIGPLQKPDYKVYAVAKDGTENDAKQTLHFDPNKPYFLPDPLTVTLGAPQGNNVNKTPVQLTGYHLDKIGKQDKVQLKPSGAGQQQEFLFDPNETPPNASFTITPGTTAAGGDGAKFEVLYLPGGTGTGVDTKIQLTIKGVLPAAPPTQGGSTTTNPQSKNRKGTQSTTGSNGQH